MALQLELATPTRLVVSEEVDEVVAPGIEGYFGVWPGHAAFLTTLGAGELSYRRGEPGGPPAGGGGVSGGGDDKGGRPAPTPPPPAKKGTPPPRAARPPPPPPPAGAAPG